MHFVSWIFKLEYFIKVEIDEVVCGPAKDFESFSFIVAGISCLSRLI